MSLRIKVLGDPGDNNASAEVVWIQNSGPSVELDFATRLIAGESDRDQHERVKSEAIKLAEAFIADAKKGGT